ncbi:MAG: glycosyltransferase family 1 protein [Tuberibacillus sp.]
MTLRILHVVVNMNRGGAETLIMNLYRHIDRSVIQFDFLTCKKGSFDDEIKALGGKVHRIPYITEGFFKYNRALEQFFQSHPEYQIVHSHLDKMSGFVLRAAMKSGVPVRIAHSHSTKSEGHILSKCMKWAGGKLLLNHANHFMACSNASARWLFRQRAEQAELLKNGISTELFKENDDSRSKIREIYNVSKDSFVVGHVGRFCQPKNHRFIIEVFSKVYDIIPRSVLVLVGDGPMKEEIKKRVNAMGLHDKVLFLGVQENIHEIIQAFDVFLFPSLYEGLPVTLIEAQSVGLPCLISEGITDEVDIGAGLIHYELLNMPAVTWAMKVCAMETRKTDVTYLIKKKGFDIEQTAILLQNYYLNVINANLHKLRSETG